MKKQQGFTLLELLVGVMFVGIACLAVAIVVTSIHVIAKFW